MLGWQRTCVREHMLLGGSSCNYKCWHSKRDLLYVHQTGNKILIQNFTTKALSLVVSYSRKLCLAPSSSNQEGWPISGHSITALEGNQRNISTPSAQLCGSTLEEDTPWRRMPIKCLFISQHSVQEYIRRYGGHKRKSLPITFNEL